MKTKQYVRKQQVAKGLFDAAWRISQWQRRVAGNAAHFANGRTNGG
ncbi:MAG: hypothetical protein GY758_28145 [Fuerstiella sp.]|nr:hypothetical protein [Fuerstiella sp.]